MDEELATRASIWIIATASAASDEVTERHRSVLIRVIHPSPHQYLGTNSNPPDSYGHLATVSDEYKPPFSLEKALIIADQKIPEIWPGLAPYFATAKVQGKIKIEQAPLDWGGTLNGRIIPTSMLQFDLGRFREFPEITAVTDPGRVRNTAHWVRLDRIADTRDRPDTLETFYTQFRTNEERVLKCQIEAGGPLVETTIRHLGVQRTIAFAMQEMLGVTFPFIPDFEPCPRVVFAPGGPSKHTGETIP